MHVSVGRQQVPAQVRVFGQHDSSMHELPPSQQVPLEQGDGHVPPELDPPVVRPPLAVPDAPLEPLAVPPLEPLAVPVPELLPAEMLPEPEPPVVKPPAVPTPLLAFVEGSWPPSPMPVVTIPRQPATVRQAQRPKAATAPLRETIILLKKRPTPRKASRILVTGITVAGIARRSALRSVRAAAPANPVITVGARSSAGHPEARICDATPVASAKLRGTAGRAAEVALALAVGRVAHESIRTAQAASQSAAGAAAGAAATGPAATGPAAAGAAATGPAAAGPAAGHLSSRCRS